MMLSLLQFLKTPVRQPKLGWCIAAILTVHVLSTQLVLRGMRTVKGGGDGMAGMANAIPLFLHPGSATPLCSDLA